MADEHVSSGEKILRDYVRSLGSKKSDFDDFETRLSKGIDAVTEAANKSVAIKDAYGNSLTAIGTDDKVKSFSTYGFDNSTLNWPLWLALYNDSWVFRRAIDKPAQDEVNCGFVLKGDGDFSKVYASYEKYKFDMIKLLQWGALFGGAVGVMLFDGIPDADLAKPMNISAVRNRRMRIYVTDRWYGVSESQELVNNMKDIDFGKPLYYNISFADGHMAQVHHSYVLRYEHRTAPQLVKCGQLQGWGYAEGSHILNELSRDDQLKSAITSLVNKSLIEVVKMSGMRGVFMGADKGNEEQLTKRLEMVNWARSYNSLTFLDKDDDYIQHELSNISGLSNLLETNMWLVASALEMQGVLFGDLKGGLSQESDAFHRYAVTIENRCDSYFRPVLQKLLTVLFLMNNVEGLPDFDFRPLDQNDVIKEKVEAISSISNMLDSLIQQGIISKYQAALTLKEYCNNGTLNIEFSDLQLARLMLEEETELLDVFKRGGREAPTQQLEERYTNRFGGMFNQNPVEEASPAVLAPEAQEQPTPDIGGMENATETGE